jgi:hypothetical protein
MLRSARQLRTRLLLNDSCAQINGRRKQFVIDFATGCDIETTSEWVYTSIGISSGHLVTNT